MSDNAEPGDAASQMQAPQRTERRHVCHCTGKCYYLVSYNVVGLVLTGSGIIQERPFVPERRHWVRVCRAQVEHELLHWHIQRPQRRFVPEPPTAVAHGEREQPSRDFASA